MDRKERKDAQKMVARKQTKNERGKRMKYSQRTVNKL